MSEQNLKDVGNAGDLWSLFPRRNDRALLRGAFDTPEAFVKYVEAGRNGAWCQTGFGEDFMADRWYGATFDEARDYCLNGWHDGAARVAALRDKINAANPIGPRVIKWDVAGAVANVPRALAGNPLNMRRIDNAKLRRRPVITIVSHYGATSDFDPDSFVNRAAVTAAIADRIEAAGYACHVIAFTVSCDESSKTAVANAITLKESTAPVDIARMAFALGHPAMLRRLTFAFRAGDAMARPLGSQRMGRTDYKLETDTAAGVFVLPSVMKANGAFDDERAAETRGLEFMLSELRRQGCPAFPEKRAAA